MTKKQMMALKPGDIVVDKDTGDQFKFVKLTKVSDLSLKNGKLEFVGTRQEIAAELIPGFEYVRRYVTSGPYFYLSHTRVALKEADK